MNEKELIDISLLDGRSVAEIALTVAERLAYSKYCTINVSDRCRNIDDFRSTVTSICELLGTLMVQNQAGDKVIAVYDRRIGLVSDGVRYHQTRQGGDIHIDSVNRPEPMKYLALACAGAAPIGGETIVIRAKDVVKVIERVDDVIDTLSQPFYFEGRGMSDNVSLFQLPVLTMVEGNPHFRYLRPYIESAHKKARDEITTQQAFAFDVLDAALELSTLQNRFMLEKGDILFSIDVETFHGRTSFIDGTIANSWSDRRHMLRYWIE